MIDLCYACEKKATTREHVPPLCLFPESKDAEGNSDLRRNLVTVPSCLDHNLGKSYDDEYLLWVMSISLPANSIAQRQIETKLSRAIRRNPKLGLSLLSDTKEVTIVESHSGREHEAVEVIMDGERFERVITLITRGLFRHHFGEQWLGSLRVMCDFVDFPDEPEQESLKANRIAFFNYAERLFRADAQHGDNPDVFWYKVNESGARCRCVMRLAFYGSCTATAMFGG